MRVLLTGHQGYLGPGDVVESAASYDHEVRRRLLVHSGITRLWQVTGSLRPVMGGDRAVSPQPTALAAETDGKVTSALPESSLTAEILMGQVHILAPCSLSSLCGSCAAIGPLICNKAVVR
jgi:hypothetical protein